MIITSLHLKILSCLIVDSYLPREISDILNISISKTTRYLSDLQYILKEKSSLGMHKKLKKNPKIMEDVKEIQKLTPKERVCYLILQFLKSNIINLTSISEEISVTRRTLAKDLQCLKKELRFFHLEIVSYNSCGVSLEGFEKNKREFFELYFIKMFIEEKYLPSVFQDFFNEIKELKKEYKVLDIINEIYEIYEEWGILRHTYVSLHIEVLIYISIIRKKFEDESIKKKDSIEDDKVRNMEKLNIILKKINFFSNYERASIEEFYLKRNMDYFFETNKKEILELKNLLKYLSEELKMEVKLNKKLLIKLTTIIAVMNFKKQFDIVEIYFFNGRVAQDYFNKFKLISSLIKKYYKDIDSFDNTILSMIILNEINKNVEKKIEKLKDLVIVYNFLSVEFIKEVYIELGLNELINNIKLISYRDIDSYLDFNRVNGIIIFEDIRLDKKYDDIKKVRFNLPIINLDKFKLSVFLDEV